MGHHTVSPMTEYDLSINNLYKKSSVKNVSVVIIWTPFDILNI